MLGVFHLGKIRTFDRTIHKKNSAKAYQKAWYMLSRQAYTMPFIPWQVLAIAV